MVQTLSIILPRTRFVLLLIGVFFFVFSIVGMELFCFLRPNQEIDGINQSYEDFFSALSALLKFSIMEAPIEQIKDAMQTSQPNFVCFEISSYEEFEKYGQNGCGRPLLAALFFIVFHSILNFLLIPIFIATIVDGYAETKELENSAITRNFISKLTEEWNEIDREAKGHISYHQFWHFCPAFMKLFEQEKSLKDIGSLARKKSDFLESVDVEVYESEEGVTCVDFHSLIVCLTKVYLEKASGSPIKEEEPHTIIRTKRSLAEIQSRKSLFASDAYTIALLRAGLQNWKDRAKPEEEEEG